MVGARLQQDLFGGGGGGERRALMRRYPGRSRASGRPQDHTRTPTHHNVVGLHGLDSGQELVLCLLVLLAVLKGEGRAAFPGLQQPHRQTWGGDCPRKDAQSRLPATQATPPMPLLPFLPPRTWTTGAHAEPATPTTPGQLRTWSA